MTPTVARRAGTVDGVENPDVLGRFRLNTPLLSVNLPEEHIFGAAPGPAKSAAVGWAVMVKPLAPGEHDLSFDVVADLLGDDAGPIDQPGTVHIVVTPHGG